MRETSDVYTLFKLNPEAFNKSSNFKEFIEMANKLHLVNYVGGWVENVFLTAKAGKETYRPLLMPYAEKFSDIFTKAYFLHVDQKDKPYGVQFLMSNAGICKWVGGTRGWSKSCPGIRSHYGAKFYGSYVTAKKEIYCKNTHYEAITRTDGILIVQENNSFIGSTWIALLPLDAKIEDMFDDETKALLAAERQADSDAWDAGDPRQNKSEE